MKDVWCIFFREYGINGVEKFNLIRIVDKMVIMREVDIVILDFIKFLFGILVVLIEF